MIAPTLFLVCGKIASGKSTKAAELANRPFTVLIAEDDWLSVLFGKEMMTIADYVRCSAKLKAAIGPHVVSLLNEGVSVVLDFPANTVADRAWLLGVAKEAGVAHELHFMDHSDETCLARLHERNGSGEHPFAVTDAQFAQITAHFVLPSTDEGLEVVVHG
ncbi:MAG: AAA family ATPase [Pikeienuella sp.]